MEITTEYSTFSLKTPDCIHKITAPSLRKVSSSLIPPFPIQSLSGIVEIDFSQWLIGAQTFWLISFIYDPAVNHKKLDLVLHERSKLI